MARQELQNFYQRMRGALPSFDVSKVDGGTQCTLRLPAISTRDADLEERSFTAVARNKKLAIAEAAEAGLDFLKQQRLFKTSQPSDSLWEVIAKLMAPGSLRKEPEFEGHVLMAQRFRNGWVPIQLLAVSRPVIQWAKAQLPEALNSPEAFLQLVQKRLQAETFPLLAQAHIEKDGGCGNVRRKDLYPGRQNIDAARALNATLDHGLGKAYKCIHIPADDSLLIEEREIQGGGCFWSTIADCLGISADQLLYWDKIGRNKEVYLAEEGLAEQLDDPTLMPLLLQYLGPLPEKSERTSAASSVPTTAESVKAASESGSTQELLSPGQWVEGLPLIEVRQPALYSQAGSTTFNRRASWLIGKPVHGNCLVSYCRLRPCEWRTPSVKWASLPLPAFWAWLGARLPSAEYACSTGTPLLARLPTKYRTAKAWFGSPPADLLAHHVASNLRTADIAYSCRPLSDDPGTLWDCTAQVTLLGDDAPVTAEVADCPTEDASMQQAALNMLHDYERRFCRVFKPGTSEENSYSQASLGHAEEISLESCGDAEVPTEGAIVKFGFRVRGVHTSPASGQLLAAQLGRFEWGCEGVVPAIESLIEACKPGGSASCRVQLPCGFPNSLSPSQIGCWLEIRPDQKVKFVGLTQSNARQDLFTPPMSTQRHEKMEAMLRHENVSTVLDIGCGEGRLIEHLLRKAKQGTLGIRKVVGLEIDGSAVKRGAKRLCTRNPGIFDGPSAPVLELYQADVVCSNASKSDWWGSYVGAEAAVFQEVIEHLDPGPLNCLGKCLLSALQPRLLFISTPNFDYNAVLHCLQSQLLPNGFRNSDHRFEWTRKQFQDWCSHIASEHGYSVGFQDFGQATYEAQALTDPESPLHGKNVGGSTQVAVFRRTDSTPPEANAAEIEASCIFDSKGRLGPSPEQFLNGQAVDNLVNSARVETADSEPPQNSKRQKQ